MDETVVLVLGTIWSFAGIGRTITPDAELRILRHSKIAITMELSTMVPGKATLAALKRLSDALSSPDAALPDDAE